MGVELVPFVVCIQLVPAAVAVRPVRVVVVLNVRALEVGIHSLLLWDYTLLAGDPLELAFASAHLGFEDVRRGCSDTMDDCCLPRIEESNPPNGVHQDLVDIDPVPNQECVAQEAHTAGELGKTVEVAATGQVRVYSGGAGRDRAYSDDVDQVQSNSDGAERAHGVAQVQ